LRVFGPRVIAGHDDHVGSQYRLRHLRPLIAIAITTRSEHDDDSLRADTPQIREAAVQCIRRVREVHEDVKRLPGNDALHASRNGTQQADAKRDGLDRHTKMMRHG